MYSSGLGSNREGEVEKTRKKEVYGLSEVSNYVEGDRSQSTDGEPSVRGKTYIPFYQKEWKR
jgi:hypothetical protein